VSFNPPDVNSKPTSRLSGLTHSDQARTIPLKGTLSGILAGQTLGRHACRQAGLFKITIARAENPMLFSSPLSNGEVCPCWHSTLL